MVGYPSYHAQKLAAATNTASIWTSTDSGANWTERVVTGAPNWASIASSSDGTVRVGMQAIARDAPSYCPVCSASHCECISCQRSPSDARSDASWSATHPVMHRNLPPRQTQSLFGRRPTRAPPGRSKPVLDHVTGGLSRPHRMARYVLECRSLRKMPPCHCPKWSGSNRACLFCRQVMLDLTRHD